MTFFKLSARKEKTVVSSLFLDGSGKCDIKAVHGVTEPGQERCKNAFLAN
jgi:hypothetical protein